MANDSRMISASLEAPGQVAAEATQFHDVIQKTLEETEHALAGLAGANGSLGQAATWQRARQIVEEFRPVPWFIWRISNFVFGTSGQIRPIPQGLVFGMRRLLFAAASDPLLGGAARVSDVAAALRVLKPDVIAAVSVMHALCRKLASRPLDRYWRPILDEALNQAQVGFALGAEEPDFGSGRGLLAGFAGSLGFAILLASGDEAQAQQANERLARGETIQDVTLSLYGCDPVQISAMTLSAAGCGRDCSFGLVSHALHTPGCLLPDPNQAQWLAAFSIISALQQNMATRIGEDSWEFLNFSSETQKAALLNHAKKVTRRGHGWSWIV